jgi:beta-phosphoglucomutase-like phosphatase (HAD superfamily)
MTGSPLSAAIFDVDGTLIDSVDFHARPGLKPLPNSAYRQRSTRCGGKSARAATI